MSEPTPQFTLTVRTLARLQGWGSGWREAPSLGCLLELGLFLRLSAAAAVEVFVRGSMPSRVCVFPDAEYYWTLAGTIRRGTLYEVVEWGDIPHLALRTPGYPAFLAGCRVLLGDRPFGARLVQAGLGMLTVGLVYLLTRELTDKEESRAVAGGRPWSMALVAALLTAIHPYFIVMSVLLLSEALFVPLMLASLWGMAVVWNRLGPASKGRSRRQLLVAFGTGAASGAAVLVRPSWAFFVLVMMGLWAGNLARSKEDVPGRALAAVRVAGAIVLGLVMVMSPWWARNARIYGRFIPTAIWMGASLYDGLNPGATGASNMDFLEAADLWPLDELDQDAELTRRALEFVREHPGRTLGLAIVKLGRYWSPWPNAEGFRSPLVAVGSSVAVVSLLGLVFLGLWRLRHDLRAWVLLAGPLFCFCALHMVFASSMRYRIPAEVPAMGLAAGGLRSLVGRDMVRRRET